MDKFSSDSLKIGDYVMFTDVMLNSFLGVEGILSDDFGILEESGDLWDSIYCVHLQRQYSAARELNAFLEKYKMDVSKITEESELTYLRALERGRENETSLNDSYMRKKLGQVVLFGDVIQLFHVKSGKYLQVVPGKLAKDERENTQVVLDASGNALSCLQICPRYKIDRDGDRILTRAEVFLRVAERGNEYIHTADRDPAPGTMREVNCSLETTSWRLTIFQSVTDSLDKSILLSSQLIFINDPETNGSLTIGTQEVSSFDDPEEEENGEKKKTPRSTAGSVAQEEGKQGDSDDEENKEEDEKEFHHPYGDIIIEQARADQMDSNFLWMIESSAMLVGGPIMWNTDQVRFKHFNSSLYLKQDYAEVTDPEDGTVSKQIVFTTTLEASAKGTLFTIQELNSTNKCLSNGKALQLGVNGAWITRGDVMENNISAFMVRGTKDKTMAVSLVCQRYTPDGKVAKEGVDDLETIILRDQVASKTSLDVFVGLSARNYIKKFYDMTELPKNGESANTVWPLAQRGDKEQFRDAIRKIEAFASGYSMNADLDNQAASAQHSDIRKERQHLMRQQGTLLYVLRMINKLVPLSEKADANPSDLGVDEQLMLKMGQGVLSLCFSILFVTIKENQENQMFVADFMPVLLAHLNTQQLAVRCVTEMLSKNLELQETKIGTREIQIFVDKLRSSKMNAMYMQLLQACCSCEGNGVDGNQCKVANMLLTDDSDDIIVKLKADYDRRVAEYWNQKSLYIKNSDTGTTNAHTTVTEGYAGDGDSPAVRGYHLFSKGLPTMHVELYSAANPLESFSYKLERIFADSVLLHAEGTVPKVNNDNFTSDKLGSMKPEDKDKDPYTSLPMISEYFVAEMFLGAEMCMDRNYVAMHKLDDLFPYDVLVSILKQDFKADLKSAACRLLMCLHVDRDPCATSKIPCLSRNWSDIKKQVEPQLPFVEESRRYTFGLIQELVSAHIKGMAGNHWNELSRHMLNMLRTLMSFNFYGTIDRMKDVIIPLVAALDRRSIVFQDSELLGHNLAIKGEAAAAEGEEPGIGGAGTTAMKLAALNSEIIAEETEEDLAVFDKSVRRTDDDENSSVSSTGGGGRRPRRTVGGMARNLIRSMFRMNSAARIAIESEDPDAAYDNGDESKKKQKADRYGKAPLHELETMVEAVDILAFCQRIIEDRNISLFMRAFYTWESESNKRSAVELFEDILKDSKVLTLESEQFDDVMIDVLMFSHTPLVQSTLEVLMAHHSLSKTLLENARGVQLLASNKREKQYRVVDHMLQQLEQNAETHELWGELATDADHETNKQTKSIMKELIEMARLPRTVLEFDEEFTADKEIQDLYRNLGCFDICFKVLGLLDSVEEDEEGELDEVGTNTRELCLLCNTLLYWFFLGNAKNQELGYGELEFFLETLGDEINSHLIVRSLFSMNEQLMKMVPHSHLADMVEHIVKEGRSPVYLALFASIAHVGEKNIVENQFEIVKTLTSPGRLQKCACFFCPVDHPDYEEKRALMAPFLDREDDISLEELPPLLAYHLVFLEVLSGCTVGKLNITTVEAKVQSVFSFADIVQSILDPGTITFAKIRLGNFFLNSIIEVELKIPGLEQSACIWQLLESFTAVLGYAKDEIRLVEKLGWQSPDISRQKIEWIIVCILITGGFFHRYYDPSAFRYNEQSNNADRVSISLNQVNDLIHSLFSKIKDIYDLDSPRLSNEMKATIFTAMDALNKKASKIIISNLLPNSGTTQLAKTSTLTGEEKLIQKYGLFLAELESSPTVRSKIDAENVHFISLLEKLPSVNDDVVADVRYETLIKKLVSHIRNNMKVVNNQKRMDPRSTKTATWIIRAFRTMIENRMGMSIYERDDEGGAEQDEAAAPVVNALNSCGATALCLDLIADGIDEDLQLEAIRMGVGLLFKEGGALEVQGLMYSHLMKTNSELFFKQVRLTLQKLQAWHNWHETIILEDGEEPNLPESILIVRFLQLMCEGHYLPNQDIMREQPNNINTFNLLDDMVNYLNCLSHFPCRTSTAAGIRISATILEVIQGPCDGNQAHFALNTELIETLNRLNRAKVINDCDEDDEIELKKTSIDIFQGVLEGQGAGSVVYERVLSVIHMDIIQIMSKNVTEKDFVDEEGKLVQVPFEPSEEQVILQTECVVLLQMLCNYKPSLYEELGISRDIADIVESGTACIEIVWRGDIHRRFFHIPKLCDFLAKSSKDALVENVDRSNSENKLIDFLDRSHDLYREVKHQELLTELGISKIFSRVNQDFFTWMTFSIAILINVLFIVFLKYNPGYFHIDDAYHDDGYVHPDGHKHTGGVPIIESQLVEYIILGLNITQSAMAFFVLVLSIVVRAPVTYAAYAEAGYDKITTIFHAATNGSTMYCFFYLILSLMGLTVADYYLPFLLLDLVAKNSTVRDVLNAVVLPRKQLMMTLVLAIFTTYIFAYFIFLYYRHDIGGIYGVGVFPGNQDCYNLMGCFKFVMSYALRQGGGVGDVLNLSIGNRWILDSLYFLIVTLMLLNIIFGIIIDTFSSLRDAKNRKMEDTEGICFICGIPKQVFDRASDEPDGFQTHISLDHNMWNYLYFIFMLWEQDKDDDDGLEQYVRRAIDSHEIIWFPMNKAIRLDQAATDEEVTLKMVAERIKQSEQVLIQKLNGFQADLAVTLDQLSKATKIQHELGNAKSGIAKYLTESQELVNIEAADARDAAGGGSVSATGDRGGGGGGGGGAGGVSQGLQGEIPAAGDSDSVLGDGSLVRGGGPGGQQGGQDDEDAMGDNRDAPTRPTTAEEDPLQELDETFDQYDSDKEADSLLQEEMTKNRDGEEEIMSSGKTPKGAVVADEEEDDRPPPTFENDLIELFGGNTALARQASHRLLSRGNSMASFASQSSDRSLMGTPAQKKRNKSGIKPGSAESSVTSADGRGGMSGTGALHTIMSVDGASMDPAHTETGRHGGLLPELDVSSKHDSSWLSPVNELGSPKGGDHSSDAGGTNHDMSAGSRRGSLNSQAEGSESNSVRKSTFAGFTTSISVTDDHGNPVAIQSPDNSRRIAAAASSKSGSPQNKASTEAVNALNSNDGNEESDAASFSEVSESPRAGDAGDAREDIDASAGVAPVDESAGDAPNSARSIAAAAVDTALPAEDSTMVEEEQGQGDDYNHNIDTTDKPATPALNPTTYGGGLGATSPRMTGEIDNDVKPPTSAGIAVSVDDKDNQEKEEGEDDAVAKDVMAASSMRLDDVGDDVNEDKEDVVVAESSAANAADDDADFDAQLDAELGVELHTGVGGGSGGGEEGANTSSDGGGAAAATGGNEDGDVAQHEQQQQQHGDNRPFSAGETDAAAVSPLPGGSFPFADTEEGSGNE